jgi:hypothetical protein
MEDVGDAAKRLLSAGVGVVSTVWTVLKWIGIVIGAIVVILIVWLIMSSKSHDPTQPTVILFGEAQLGEEDKRKKKDEKINLIKCNAQYCTDGTMQLLPAMRLDKTNNLLLMKRGEALQLTARAGTYTLRIELGHQGASLQSRPRLRIGGSSAPVIGADFDASSAATDIIEVQVQITAAYLRIEEASEESRPAWVVAALPRASWAAAPPSAKLLTAAQVAEVGVLSPCPTDAGDVQYYLFKDGVVPESACGEKKTIPIPDFPTRIRSIRLTPST